MPPEVIGVRRVAVTMKAVQQVADIKVDPVEGHPKLMG